MPEIQAPRIVNERQDDITQKLILDYKNFEKYKWYNKETEELWKKYLKNMRNKLNKSVENLNKEEILKKEFPDKLREFETKYTKYEKEIIDYTKKLGIRDYVLHHKETLNKLWSIIDNYENEVIQLIKDLVDDIWDHSLVNEEKWKVETANQKVKYVEIWEDWVYRLTKATNKPKIHQVLWGVLSPWEVRKIDYSQCTNSSIKSRMINAISSNTQEWANQSSNTCYLNYDQQSKTYVLSDWQWNPISQRALIWEGVKLTPPSKIRWEAKIAKKQAEQAQIEKINNVKLTEQEQQDLIDSMQEKLRKSLKKEDRDKFFQITESSINEAIKQAKLEWYELQNPPVWKRGWKDYYLTLNLRNAGSKAEIKRPFIEKEKLKQYWIEDNNKFKNYITQRVSVKRNSFDYLTKKWSTINEKDYWVWTELEENEKEFAIKWLQMLWNRADAVLEKIWNTKIKDDDIEFTALKTYTRDAINDIETWKFTDKNMENIKNEITSMLKKFFKHNRLRSSMQINENDIKWCIDDILSSWNKNSQIISMRKLWVSRTWFDNSQTAFLRDEIFEEYWRVPKKDENWDILKDEDWNIIYEEWIVDLKKDDYEKYFEKINELYSVNPEEDIWEDGEVREPKKSNIDALYEAAKPKWKHSVKNFKKWLVEQWLIPNWRWHWWQIDDKIRALKSQLEQQEKNANKFKITWQEIKERARQQLAELQLNLTSSQIKKAEQEEWNNDENIAMLNWLNFMLQQDDSFFQELAENETKNTIKSIKYCWVDGVVRWNLAPYLIRRWWWINSDDEIAKIYNDSVWAWWFFDFSDEWSERVWPILKEIIVEVVVTAVSILLCWNGAWEAIYVAFRTAKSLTKWLKWIQKLWKFFKVFNTSLFKTWRKQFMWKFTIKGAKWAKTVTQVSHIATSTEKWIKLTQKVKNTIQIIKETETLGSLAWKLAMKWWSMIIEWTTFHISSTLIHNVINWEDFLEWLKPRWYTEWPDWERIPNWQSYAQSIAFLGILKATWKVIGEVNGRIAELVTKDSYTPSMVNKIFSRSLWLGWEMWWMMLTDQILSLTFDQSLKPISWEELISMFGMVVWLRLNWKFQMRIKEHALHQSTIEMTQEWTWNKFDVRIDKEWNILKVEWVDKNWNKIKNPEQVCWLKAWEYWMNMRDISSIMWDKTWTIEWWKNAGKNLKNLNSWDEISVQHGENKIKLKKTQDWKREVSDSGWSDYVKWTKFDVEKKPNDNSYHLKNSEWRWTISLDWTIDVRLQSRYWEKSTNQQSFERPDTNKSREKVEKTKSDIKDAENRLKENENKIKWKEKKIKELEESEKKLNEEKEKTAEKEKELKDGWEKLEQKQTELKTEKENERKKLNDLEKQALEQFKWENIYIDWVEYSCGNVETNPDGTAKLTIKITWNSAQIFSDNTAAPKKYDINSYKQLETIWISKTSGSKRKVRASKERNDVYEPKQNLSQKKLQNKIDNLFNPKWSDALWNKIETSRNRLKEIGKDIETNKKEIKNNKEEQYRLENQLKEINENLLNNQSEQVGIETEIRWLRWEESKIKTEIEKLTENLTEADKELLKAETEYEKIKKEIEEKKFQMWGESTEWDWSPLWDEIIKELENELRIKEEAIRDAKEKINKLSGWHKEKAQEAKPSQENDTETPQQKIQKLKEKSSKIEQEQAELKNQTKELENQLNEMKRNKKIEIDWQEVDVTQDVIDATERQIKNNKENITKNEKALKENKEKINEQRIELEKSKWWIVNIEQDGTISILKSDFSMEKILPDWTVCKWDFDINWNLISWLKTHSDWSREYWTYNERWEMIFWVKETILQEWWFKQTYMTIDWIYEVKLDANKKMVWNMEKIADWYSAPISQEKAKWIVNRFKKFKEEQKTRQEKRRIERKQRAKEREQARENKLTYKEKRILNDIIKEVPTLPENVSKEYDLWNWEVIEIKKQSWEEYYSVFKNTKLDNDWRIVWIDLSWELKTKTDLESFLKKRIIENKAKGIVSNSIEGWAQLTENKKIVNEDWSTFEGEVDYDGKPKQWILILEDWTVKKWIFVEGKLNEWIEIKNENQTKKIEFKWKINNDLIKKEFEEIERTIGNNEKLEIKISEDKTIKIEKKWWDLVEIVEWEWEWKWTQTQKIDNWKLWEHVERRIKEIKLKQEIDKFTTSKTEKESELGELKKKWNLTEEEKAKQEKLEKQIKSYEKAIETLNDRNTKYETGIQRVKEKIEKQKEKLKTFNRNSPEYRNSKKDIEKLEKQLMGYETAKDIMQNWTEIVKKVSRREILKKELETLVLKVKKLVTNKESNAYKELEIKINEKNKEINILKTDIQKFIDITYVGIRDLKWLWDEDLMYLTHTYLEKILDPIKFSVIDHLSTFNPLKVDQNFQSIKKFETTWKNTEIAKIKEIEWEIREIKKWWYEKIKSMKDTKEIIDKFWEGTMERDILNSLKESLENNISNSDNRLLDSEKAVIFVNSVSYMLDYKAAFPNASAEQIHEILDRNQNKLIHQHIQDKRYLTWSSHDALHILRWNMDMAENFMKNMSPLERVITRQIIIDHDMWYTSQFNELLSRNRSNTFFSSTKDHPLRSTVFVEQNKSRYIKNFWKEWYDIIEKSITGHSKADTKNLPAEGREYQGKSDWKVINSVISTVDCAAASADYKSAFLFSHPEMTWQFINVYKAMKECDVEKAITHLEKMANIAESVKDPQLRNALKEALNSLHLVNVNGEGKSVLREKINKIESSDVNKLTNDFIDGLIKSFDANSDNPTKKFKKTINKFAKVNNMELDTSKIKTIEDIKTFCNKNGEQLKSWIKKYLKYDYIDERVSFPFEKYLSQYWVRVSRTETWEIKINSNNNWIVEAEFELAWKTFEILAKEWDANFALASFKKVCDDFNIDIKNNEWINNLEETINDRKKQSGKTLIEFLKEELNGKEFKDKDNNIVWKWFEDRIELYWKNWEKVTLTFEWKSYEWFDRNYKLMEKFEEIRNWENIYSTGDYENEINNLINIVNEIHWENNNYEINWKLFAQYIHEKTLEIKKYENNLEQAKKVVEETLDEIEKWTFTNY